MFNLVEALALVCFAIALVALAIFSTNVLRARETKALEEETEEDFNEEFEVDDSGRPSSQGMKDLVEWMEEDQRFRKIENSDVIEQVQEIPTPPRE